MLRQRLFFGACLIVVLIGLIIADDRLGQSDFAQNAPTVLQSLGMVRCQGLVVTVILAVVVILGTRELLRLMGSAGYAPLRCWPMVVNLSLVLIPFISANGRHADPTVLHTVDTAFTSVCIIIAFLGTGLFVAGRRKTDGAVTAMGATLLAIIYLGLLPQYLLRLRVFGPTGATWLLLYFIFTVKVCDIGAYFTGLLAGRHKLIEWLSPKKTIEGFFGGVAASVAFAVGVPILVRMFVEPASPIRDLFPPALRCVSFGVLMALIGQGGDLFESLIKRDAQAKDSAKAIPAFGGILDLMDSLLPTAPLACWILLK